MGRKNPGVPVFFGGHNLPPVVEIGLTDLPWHTQHPQERKALAFCLPEHIRPIHKKFKFESFFHMDLVFAN